MPRWRVASVGRQQGQRHADGEGGGWRVGGGGEIKVHTVRHTDEAQGPSPWHTQPCSGRQATGEHGEPQG